MSIESERDEQRRIDHMKLGERLDETFQLMKRMMEIIKSAADAGNVQCQEGLKELCNLKKSSNSSAPVMADKS